MLGRNKLVRLHDRWRSDMLGRPCVKPMLIFDLDTTVLTVYGRQQGAAVGFNPHKRGRPSYVPLLCFEGGSADVYSGSYHPGNTHPSTVIRPMLEDVCGKIPEGTRQIRVRADGAFFDHQIIEFIEKQRAFYVIVALLSNC